jgi:hypothetical protein
MMEKEGYLMVRFMDGGYVIYYTAAIVHAFCKSVTDVTTVRCPHVLVLEQHTGNMNNIVNVLYILNIEFVLISRKYINARKEDWNSENSTAKLL